MGFFCGIGASSPALLCDEDKDSVLGCYEGELEAPEMEQDLDFPAFSGLPLESDEVVASLMEKEKEQLVGITAGDYLQKLNSGGLELSWRIAAIDWINEAQVQHKFGPLCVYLAINYLDRFLSSEQLPVDKPWMQQLLSVACLSIASKMEETVVPQYLDFQLPNTKCVFEAKSIKRVEILVLSALNWRMQAVTPFSYTNYFTHKFLDGKSLNCGFVSRCTELILGTLKAIKFLQFRPSEIAAAVVLSAATETQVVDFSYALFASNVPIDKENVRRCHEAMQELGLVKKNTECSVSPLLKSPSGVLDASCFSFKIDDNQKPGSSQANSNNTNNNQAYKTPASKKTRLDDPAQITII